VIVIFVFFIKGLNESMNDNKKVLGILGGMGPQATIDLQQKILNFTDAARDQEHMRIFVDSHPQIPDRVSAMLHGGASPVQALMESVIRLDNCGVECIAMPCVTAHYFLPQFDIPPHIEFLSILKIVVKICLDRYLGKTAGILSTEGTMKSGIITDLFEKIGIPYIKPKDEDLLILEQLIRGVKAKANMDEIVVRFGIITDEMSARGAEYFILGCTEIPIIVQAHKFPYDFVDPTTELAKAAIKACGYRCL
jgi:aspartate racemase